MEERFAEETEVVIGERDKALGQLEASQALAFQRAAEIAELEREAAELAREAAEHEREAAEAKADAAIKDLEINRHRARRNIGIAIGAVLLLILFGIWQRYRYLLQRKAAKLEQQRAERLEQIDRLKDQFLANTSHELRTPLNGIIGIAESLYDGVAAEKPKEQQENLAMIIASGRRLSNLVNDILDFSKIKNSELDLQLKAIHLRSLADVICKINQPMAEGQGITLRNAISADLPAAQGDENRLQQILYNLVDNAIKFSSGGEVVVDAEQKEAMLVISVKDQGIGISKEKQAEIFEAFRQGDGSTQRQYGGTGLGLSISKKLVELQGGEMWVESAKGEGSTFYFSLPVSAEKAIAMASGTSLPPAPLSKALADPLPEGEVKPILRFKEGDESEPVHILVVDDEPINQQVLKNHLSDGPYHIIQAYNGDEALAALSEHDNIDLVLLDIMMPRMSGYEVCQRIREHYLPSELPVIMITAKNQVSDLVERLTYGANDYLAKPFSKDEFLARIKTHINLMRINLAYGHFVPHEFLRNLGRDSIIDVRLGDQTAREVTIMFADIRSYTTLAETMTPEENFTFLNSYLGRIGPVITAHNGFVNQYYGDGLMALFMKNYDDGISAAIKMQQSISAYNEHRKAKGRIPIRVGIGLHSGPIIMGILGDSHRRDPNVVSDTVNTASRMEGLTKFYGANVLVSEATLAGLPDPFKFKYRFLGKVQVKGKRLPIGVYEFFGGDPEALQAKKMQTNEQFEAGMRAYYARKFDDAIAAFDAVLAINADDKPAECYRRKSEEFLSVNLPEDWDGVEQMETK
jgi:signal transduction histidine kinase/class 3 adenylate cyclase/CheY-like chemotaxis protein